MVVVTAASPFLAAMGLLSLRSASSFLILDAWKRPAATCAAHEAPFIWEHHSQVVESDEDLDAKAPRQWHRLSPNTRRGFFGSMVAVAGMGLSVNSYDVVAVAAMPPPETVVRDAPLRPGVVSPAEVARRLRQVPTFAIVDRRGVPFMVFGEDAKLTAYFFTEYGEAARILKVARESSDVARAEMAKEIREKRKEEGKPPLDAKAEADEVGPNPWKDARISTVPLDFAVTLATRSTKGAYFKVAPSEDDVSDALSLDKSGKDELAEGKVPLFYFEEFEVPATELPDLERDAKEAESLTTLSPLYFRKSQAVSTWKRQNPKTEVPEVKVTELFSVITEMVKPGGDDEELKKLVFVPPVESFSKEKECKRAGGKEQPFILGERIVIL